MKKRLLLAAAAIAFLFTFNSCKPVIGSGAVKDESRPVSASFNSIDISAPVKANITIQEGATASVQLSGYENLLKEIKTEIKDNTLHITLPDGMRVETDKEVIANITVPSLAALDLSGASDADIKGKITGNEFSLDLSGSSHVVAEDISTSKFSVDVSGSGHIAVNSGTIQEADFAVSGSGNISAFGLQSQSVDAAVSGSGSIELTAMQHLDAAISGSGNVKYKGHPQVSQDISGSGSVSDAN